MNPNYAPVYIELGQIYEARRDFRKAAEAFETYLMLAPNYQDSVAVRERAQRAQKLATGQGPSLFR
jgi:tetratricopeptide (TPR) repeat protein